MGVAKPADMGVDVMQFNLHKTFSTPHGGGGPGAGPVAVRASIADYLPVPAARPDGRRPRLDRRCAKAVGRMRSFYGHFGRPLARVRVRRATRWPGLAEVTRLAVLNANYVRARLCGTYHLPYGTRRCTNACSPTAISRTSA